MFAGDHTNYKKRCRKDTGEDGLIRLGGASHQRTETYRLLSFFFLRFRSQKEFLKLFKRDIKLHVHLIAALDTDRFHKLCRNHLLGLKRAVVVQFRPVHHLGVFLPDLLGS